MKSTDLAVSAALGFAAKEASAKALGTGFGEGVLWLDFEIGPAEPVKPVRLQGSARDYAFSKLPAEMLFECQTWVSSDHGWSIAVALISDQESKLEQTLDWGTIFEAVVKPALLC